MNPYYSEIMNSPFPEDVKAIIRKWHTLSQNIRTADRHLPIVLPDMFWVAHTGAGKTTLLRLMAGYLKEQENLMSFHGNVDVFEFLLGYCRDGEPFYELQRLMDTVKGAAGFRSEYKGVMCIDIDEWVGHHTERHFISFMEYLAGNSEEWLIILSVSPHKQDKLRELQAFLAMYLRLEMLRLELPSTPLLCDFLASQLEPYGLTLTDDAKVLLCDAIDAMRKNKRFDGYKSMRLFAKDIVYRLFSREQPPAHVLSATDLTEFSKYSRYVQDMTFVATQVTNTIGF